MSFSIKRQIYESSPLWVKRTVGLIPFSWLAGSNYGAVYRRGEWLDRADRTTLLGYQEQALGKVLEFAVAEVPAYQPLKDVVARFKPFDALRAFPLLNKDDLQENLERYLPKSFQDIPHYETTTGGTSGNQLRVFLDDNSQSMELGFMHRQWRRVGYLPRHRKATFRGVAFRDLRPGVFWQHNPIYNELQFSPFHMSEKNLAGYVAEIVRFKPRYLHGYPSALDILAEFVLRHGLSTRLPDIQAALLGSEGATTLQRGRIERAFRTRAYGWYGHSERVVLAGGCERNETYHSFPDYGVLEIIDDQGCTAAREGDRGEIIGTGLFNFCMPLIRYRTGDYATWLEPRCDCGRVWDRFTAVEGRWKQEMVIGHSGARISLAALNMHGPLFERVKRFQYHQDEPGVCVLKVMPAPDFTDQDRARIETAYREKLGNEVEMRVEPVADIPLTQRGKLRMLVSRLSPQGIGCDGASGRA